MPSDDQAIKRRRIDAVSANSTYIEMQNSPISAVEVRQRKTDYGLHGVNLVWIVNGEGVTCTPLNVSNTFLLSFAGEGCKWKWASFHDAGYACVLVHIDEYVYKVPVADIRSSMIDVASRLSVDECVSLLNTGAIDAWDATPLTRSTLFFNQRGAGCGKTYESIQLCTDSRFLHKTTFVYLTKMHSAKQVIFDEWREQLLHGSLCTSVKDVVFEEPGKQFRIFFTRSILGEEDRVSILIGTIDSFMYALGNKLAEGRDFFAALVGSIRDGFVARLSSTGGVAVGGTQVELNRRALIVVDEAQDLPVLYVEALASIMRNTYIDCYVIGDKLQSLMVIPNIHTFLETATLPHTDVVKSEGVNVVRRFHDGRLADFVNAVVPFAKFGLPAITGVCTGERDGCGRASHSSPPEFAIKPFHFKHENQDMSAMIDNVEHVMQYVHAEVVRHNYGPEHFMFVFPLVKTNSFACVLECSLQQYWLERLNNREGKYVFFHKSQEGEPINLGESTHATRILSIHAAKGTGREVVFVLGLSSAVLSYFHATPGDLKFESMVHVALTRAKQTMYVGMVQQRGDELYERLFANHQGDSVAGARLHAPVPSCKLNSTQMTSAVLNSDELFDQMDALFGLRKWRSSLFGDSDSTRRLDSALVDYGHHVMRYGVMCTALSIDIFNAQALDEGCSWVDTRLAIVSQARVELLPPKLYWKRLKDMWNPNASKKVGNIIPVLQFEATASTRYVRYAFILQRYIKRVQRKLVVGLQQKSVDSMCPLESVVLQYCINVKTKRTYSTTSNMDVYHVMACYEGAFKTAQTSHAVYNCLCDAVFGGSMVFGDSATTPSSRSLTSFQEDIIKHHERLVLMKHNYDSIVTQLVRDRGMDEQDAKQLKFVGSKKVEYGPSDASNGRFELCSVAHFEGRCDTDAVHIYITPVFNELNALEIGVCCAFTRFLMLHDSYVKCASRMHTFVVALNLQQPLLLDFIDVCSPLNTNMMSVLARMHRDELTQQLVRISPRVFEFYKWCRDENRIDKRSGVESAYDEIERDMRENPSVQRGLSLLLHFLGDLNGRLKAVRSVDERRALTSEDGFVQDLNSFFETQTNGFFCIDNGGKSASAVYDF